MSGSGKQKFLCHQMSMRAIGDGKDASRAYDVGKNLASYLKELGFNIDLLLMDVITEFWPVIGRSFEEDPRLVGAMASQQVVKELQDNGQRKIL